MIKMKKDRTTISRRVSKLISILRSEGVKTALTTVCNFTYRKVSPYTVIPILRILNENELLLMEINNHDMYIDLSNPGMSRVLFWYGVHEPKITSLWKQEIKSGMSVIDIGSHIGYYSLLAAENVGTNGSVHAIEPDERNYFILNKNIDSNNYNNIKTYNIAISDQTGTTRLFKSNTSNYNTLDQRTATRQEKKYTHSSQVKGVSFGDFIKNNDINDVDVIRMDLEGYETRIIDGMEDILKTVTPPCKIFIETHNTFVDSYSDMFEFYSDLGFSPEVFTNQQGTQVIREFGNGDPTDILESKNINQVILTK